MKKLVLSALGAVFPLAALAVLTIIMPPLGTWAIVVGIAVVAGVLLAWVVQELGQRLMNVREGIDTGNQTTTEALEELGHRLMNVREGIDTGNQTMIEALEKANEETRVVQSEANKKLAERFERFFEEYGQRDEDWRAKTLAEWQAATQALGSSFEKMLSDIRSHNATLAEQERVLQEEAAKSRTEAMLTEVKQVRSEFERLCEETKETFERLCEGTKETMEQHAAVIQTTAKTVEDVEAHFAKQQENEAETRQAALAEWQAVTQALGASFEKNLTTLAEQERVLQEEAAKSRTEAINAELRNIKQTFEQLRRFVETEGQRQQDQKRIDRDHLEKMLADQRKAHDEVGERSEKLWGHLLDRLKNDGQ